jgi:hypothetical protein
VNLNKENKVSKIILVAGATGNLGNKIVDELLKHNAIVKAIVRDKTDQKKIQYLASKNVEICKIKEYSVEEIALACKGVDCVVSVLAGFEDTIVDAQKILVEGAIKAKVPRFIPSDFCTDYTNLIYGKNRNLDFRKKFHDYLNQQSINSTSIFNGAFMELTTGDMPLILFAKNKILCWGGKNIKMDLTITYNIAAYTAQSALDDTSPRYLKIAGESISCAELANMMTQLTNSSYKIFKPGSIGLFNVIISITKFFDFSKKELYPAWQGMQYMRDMMEGRAQINQHDNDRYPVAWTRLKDHLNSEKKFLSSEKKG